MLRKLSISSFMIASILGMSSSIAQSAIATPRTPDAPLLLATAYTDRTLPTLRRGDRGQAVRKLQRILQDNGFLGAASQRLGEPGHNSVDGVFGVATEIAIRDLQRRYKLRVTGVVNPATWEILDMKENPYHSPLPFLY